MQLTFEQRLRIFIVDSIRYKNAIVLMFIVISLTAVGIGLSWPKTYTSSATVFVEQSNILQPLMQGTAAVTMQVIDQARMAREVIFGRTVMKLVMEHAGWIDEETTEIEQDRIMETVKKQTKVINLGANLIKIEHDHSDPNRAYETTEKFAELLISRSADTQSGQSRKAFEFIELQVDEYHKKLTWAEQQLKEFRSKHVDARPGTGAEIVKRINAHKTMIEKTTLEFKEAQIRKASLESQLSGEAEITVSLAREGRYQSRIAELQSQLDNLRLSYHDIYPDIVRIQHQIEDLKENIVSERQQREEAKKSAQRKSEISFDKGVRVNPLYEQLRSTYSETKINIDILQTRLVEMKKLLRIETERAKRMYGGEATYAELTRDYDVNRDIYQDLLRQRENARVSMNIDREQRGLTIRLHEPAIIPLRPSGLRFIHFAIGGVLLGLLVPFGLLYGWQLIDPRVRCASIISDKLGIPVVGTVPRLVVDSEARAQARNLVWLSILVLLNISVISVVGYLKFTEVL